MNYALDALWWRLTDPNVRDLAAILTAPPLWHSGCELPLRELLGETGFRYLLALDSNPAPLQQHLAAEAPFAHRLGFYAESLLAEAQVFGRKQKAVLDQVAAQAILQGFVEGGAAEYFNGCEAADED